MKSKEIKYKVVDYKFYWGSDKAVCGITIFAKDVECLDGIAYVYNYDTKTKEKFEGEWKSTCQKAWDLMAKIHDKWYAKRTKEADRDWEKATKEVAKAMKNFDWQKARHEVEAETKNSIYNFIVKNGKITSAETK